MTAERTVKVKEEILRLFSQVALDKMNILNIDLEIDNILDRYDFQEKQITPEYNNIEELIGLFMNAIKLEGFSNVTIYNYNRELLKFSSHVNTSVNNIKAKHIREYLASKQGLTMNSIATNLSVIKSFFSWLTREGIIIHNPTIQIRTPKIRKRNPKGLAIEQLEEVRESCKTLRERALLEVFYSTGCRLNELRSIKINDVNHQNMSLSVVGKGDKERTVYLSYKAIYHLDRYLKNRTDNCEYLFITLRKPFRQIGSRAIQREIERIWNRTNIENKLTPHVFRHTFANLSMDQGIDLADLQHLMGHENPSTTLIYSQVSEERKKRAFKRYHIQ